jgi:hypothetical protein
LLLEELLLSCLLLSVELSQEGRIPLCCCRLQSLHEGRPGSQLLRKLCYCSSSRLVWRRQPHLLLLLLLLGH